MQLAIDSPPACPYTLLGLITQVTMLHTAPHRPAEYQAPYYDLLMGSIMQLATFTWSRRTGSSAALLLGSNTTY